jgi:amino acid adenylation domain-containing protein
MPVHHGVLSPIAERVSGGGDGTAIVDGPRRLSYRRLWRDAGRVAAGLRARGLRPGATVAVRLGGADRVVAMLGVLRAGMIYCPLDPQSPPRRLRHVLADSRAEHLIVPDATGHREAGGPPVATVGALLDHAAVHPTPTAVTDADAPAYLIYTSGSTGTPKGILVGHRALGAYLSGAARRYRVKPGDVMLQFASAEFDASIEDTLITLCAGARLVTRPPDLLGSVHRFLEFCRAENVTLLDLPTAYWHLLVAGADEHRLALPPALRQVIIGGEQVRGDLLPAWERLAGDRVRLVNSYGPAETTVVVTTADLSGRDAAATPPIGTAIPGVRLHVAAGPDRSDTGELWIGGPTVAIGYWAAPALTAAAFRPDPHGRGARVFRSGDRVRRDPDGTLTFLGRIDDQVKIAGHRVDPADLEAVLRDVPGVADAAVVPLRDAGGTSVRSLAAFLVPAPAGGPTARQVTDLLGDRVPAAARPTVLRTVGALPLGATGKVDRSALDPDRDGVPLPPGIGYVAPRDEAEWRISRLWQDLLGADRVGLHDDFLMHGGDSLAAMRCVTRLRDEHGADLPISAVLGGDTVERVAARITAAPAVAPSTPAEEPPAGTGPAPLSLSQERVWFLTELEPGNPAYQFQMSVRLLGPLDVPALGAALTALIGRHEILRTTFALVDGEPAQRVHPPAPAALTVLDPAQVSAAGGPDAALTRAYSAGFELGRLPLIRWTLLTLAPGDHLLVHMEHHMVHDGWSLSRLLDDLQHAYGAAVAGREPAWAAPAPRFTDYARAQRRWLASPEAARQRAYWRERLAGAPALTVLPADRPRPHRQSFRGAVVKRTVPTGLAARVRAAAGRHDATVFAVMMAAFTALVHRYTGQTDLSLGTSVANRADRRWEDLVGMLVNNVVLRLAVRPTTPGPALVRQVRDAMLAALDHQQLPFEQVVEQSRTDRDLTANPLFQLMFSFHDSPVGELSLGPVRGRVGYLSNTTAKFDLNVVVIPRPAPLADGPAPGAMVMEWEYNSDLFDRATVSGFVDAYLLLLDGLAEAGDGPVADLPLLGAGGRERLRALGTGARADDPAVAPGADLWSAVREQARLRPDAIAARGPDGQVSYAALVRRVARVARLLTRRGAGPESVVAVEAGRTTHTLVGALATYAAGAAFLLLDDDLPEPRRRLILADSAAMLVLTAAPGRPDDSGPERLRLDLPPDDAGAEPPHGHRAVPGNLAYLVYTSGSTGRPKGVLLTRAGLGHYLAWCRRYRMRPGDRVPVHTPFTVDLTVTSLLAPLAAGATVELLPDGYAGLDAVAEAVAGGAADLVKLTPSHLRGLAAQLGDARPDRPLTLVLGGEALFDRDLVGWPAQTRIVNEYGPTEAVVGCVTAVTAGGGGHTGAAVPIGFPMDHVRACVVDAGGRLLPAGAVGELLIGGVGLARGYLGAPGRTADQFRPDPHASRPGARAYRSGDRVRWSPGAGLEYLGRADRQVKVRGFRVDPAEIETVLTELRGGRPVAVRLVGEGLEQRLVAYLSAAGPDGERPPAAAELRHAAAARLPAHMVPTAYVTVGDLPVGPGGKVDHSALPDPPLAAQPAAAPAEPPATGTERLVAGIWQDVLGAAGIGATGDFFALGGHSLAAVRVVARLRDGGHPGVRLHDLFTYRTVRDLAGRLDSGGAPARTGPRHPLAPGELTEAELDRRLAELLTEQGEHR